MPHLENTLKVSTVNEYIECIHPDWSADQVEEFCDNDENFDYITDLTELIVVGVSIFVLRRVTPFGGYNVAVMDNLFSHLRNELDQKYPDQQFIDFNEGLD